MLVIGTGTSRRVTAVFPISKSSLLMPVGMESWLGKFEHQDKWSFCLKAASMRAAQEKQ
jgi:hypothetical protein